MNLISGLENHSTLFWWVASGSVFWGAGVYGSLCAYFARPLYNSRRRLANMTALQDLLVYNVDIIGEARSWSCLSAFFGLFLLLVVSVCFGCALGLSVRCCWSLVAGARGNLCL